MQKLAKGFRFFPSQKHVGRKSRTVVSSSGSAGDEELLRILQLYSDNKIRTTKYSLLSFLPKNLLEQLHRFANIYFLFLAALNFVPVVEAFQPEVAVIPVVLVMSVTAIKDIWEDYRRSKLDRFMNKLYCQVYRRYGCFTWSYYVLWRPARSTPSLSILTLPVNALRLTT